MSKRKIFIIMFFIVWLVTVLLPFEFHDFCNYKWKLLYKIDIKWKACGVIIFGNDGSIYNQNQTQIIGEWQIIGTNEIYFKLFSKCERLNGFIFLSPGAAMDGYAHIADMPVKIFICKENRLK